MAKTALMRKVMKPFRKLKRKYNINKAKKLFKKGGENKKWSF